MHKPTVTIKADSKHQYAATCKLAYSGQGVCSGDACANEKWLRELWSCAWMWPVILMTIANVAFDIFPCKSFVALSLRLWRDIIQNALATAVQDTQLQTAIGTSPKAKTNVQSMCGNDDECMSMCTCTLYIHVSVLGMCVCSSCLHVSVLGMCMCTLYGLTDHDS